MKLDNFHFFQFQWGGGVKRVVFEPIKFVTKYATEGEVWCRFSSRSGTRWKFFKSTRTKLFLNIFFTIKKCIWLFLNSSEGKSIFLKNFRFKSGNNFQLFRPRAGWKDFQLVEPIGENRTKIWGWTNLRSSMNWKVVIFLILLLQRCWFFRFL